jgi:6-phosphogluconolactonase (cycloisomerase 2 family)
VRLWGAPMPIIQPMRATVLCFAVLSLLAASTFGAVVPRFAFVANTTDGTVSVYTVNASTGQLRDDSYVVVGKKPASAIVTPNGSFLYVANSGSSNVSAFSVNAQNGSLTVVTGSPFAAKTGPSAVATDPAGKFLFVANKTSGDISAYTINSSTGALTAVSGSPFVAGTSPVALAVDPSGKFLYVANSGSGNVSAYTINSSDGALTPISGAPFEAGTTPAGISIAPSGKFVYVANTGSNNVSGYSLNTTSGVLTAISGSPFKAGTKPSSVAVDTQSKYVYVANSGSNNVSEFSLNASTGALTALAGSPVSAGTAPLAITVDPSGKFVFTGNGTSDDVSGFSLNSSTGALTTLVPGPVRARKKPVSVAVSSGTSAITYTPNYVFAADFEGGVPVLSVNTSSGALTSVKGSPFGSGSPRSIALALNGNFLYTANSDGTNTIGEYSVNQTTGAVTSVGTIASGDAPYWVAVDPSSRFVYAVAINTNGVYAYTINQTTGALKAISGSPFTTDVESPGSVTVDPTGRFLIVAEACCADTAGVSVYSIAPATGKLTAVKGSPFLPPSGTSEPSSVTVDPTGRYVYVANGGSFGTGGATVYSLAASTGKLTLVGTLTPGGSSPWGITTDVTGSYVYMTNNDSTIYAYAINNSTGALTNIKGSPFSGLAATRGVAADPSGKFLYIANSSQLLGYSIKATTGALTVLGSSPYSAGSNPISLTIGGTIH